MHKKKEDKRLNDISCIPCSDTLKTLKDYGGKVYFTVQDEAKHVPDTSRKLNVLAVKEVGGGKGANATQKAIAAEGKWKQNGQIRRYWASRVVTPEDIAKMQSELSQGKGAATADSNSNDEVLNDLCTKIVELTDCTGRAPEFGETWEEDGCGCCKEKKKQQVWDKDAQQAVSYTAGSA